MKTDKPAEDLPKLDPPFDQRKRRRRFRIGGLILAVLLLLGFLLYSSCSRAIESAEIVQCANNLKVIGWAIAQYTSANKGVYPDSFSTLLMNEDVQASEFICPASKDATASGPTTQAVRDNLREEGHHSYVYLGADMTTADVTANKIVAYEPLKNHGKGANFLFGNGHVEFLEREQAEKTIANLSARPTTLPTAK